MHKYTYILEANSTESASLELSLSDLTSRKNGSVSAPSALARKPAGLVTHPVHPSQERVF